MKKTKKMKNARLIPAESVSLNPNLPRRYCSPDALAHLADSISRCGMIEPITVRKKNGGYELITGERRLMAARMLDMRRVPAIVLDLPSRTAAEIAVASNVLTETPDIFEDARKTEVLMKQYGYTPEELGLRLGQTPGTVAGKVRILQLLPEEKRLIRENGLTFRHARALARLSDRAERMKILDEVISRECGARQTEMLVSGVPLFAAPAEKPPEPRPMRKFIPKDARIFTNSVDNAISAIKEAYSDAETKKEEDESGVKYYIRIPK